MLFQTMDKEEPKFENKYLSSPLKKKKKKQMQQHLCVFFVCPQEPKSLSCTEKHGQYSLFNGHAVHRITRPLTEILWSSNHSLVGRWVEDDRKVNVLWSKRLRDHSPQLDWTVFLFL